jgi:hypothetical protein
MKRFVLGGRAVITLESGRTGTRYTYRVVSPARNRGGVGEAFRHPVRFVFVLVEGGEFKYVGRLFRGNLKFTLTDKSVFSWDAPVVRAFNYFLDGVREGLVSNRLAVYHSSRCGCCGRELTDPQSVLLGIGPDCRGQLFSSEIYL